MQKTINDALNRLSVAEFKSTKKNEIIVVLDNIRSLNNVGSIFRTADAFNAAAIYLCGYTPTPPHRDINKTALGATESVEWAYFETTLAAIENLRKNNFKIYAIEQAEPKMFLNEFYPKEKIALIFGSEVGGVADEVMAVVDGCIEIPQWGTKHSLNIAVSVGVVLWDAVNKINKI